MFCAALRKGGGAEALKVLANLEVAGDLAVLQQLVEHPRDLVEDHLRVVGRIGERRSHEVGRLQPLLEVVQHAEEPLAGEDLPHAEGLVADQSQRGVAVPHEVDERGDGLVGPGGLAVRLVVRDPEHQVQVRREAQLERRELGGVALGAAHGHDTGHDLLLLLVERTLAGQEEHGAHPVVQELDREAAAVDHGLRGRTQDHEEALLSVLGHPVRLEQAEAVERGHELHAVDLAAGHLPARLAGLALQRLGLLDHGREFARGEIHAEGLEEVQDRVGDDVAGQPEVDIFADRERLHSTFPLFG